MTPVEVSINEMRERAAQFALEWRGETYERGESQSFWNDWFEIFGIKRRRVATFEHYVSKLSGGNGFIDLFWPGHLVVEQKSANKDLAAATGQAFDYLAGLTEKEVPRMVISSDFATFHIHDLDSGEVTDFLLEELPQKIESFAWIAGYERRSFEHEDQVNIKAAELMGRLYDLLEESGYAGHALRVLLVRLLFILFADDTGIWEHNLFGDYLMNQTAEDGRDVGMHLAQLFQVLNTPEELRQSTLEASLAPFPYINGDLFAEPIPMPSFNSKMRSRLVDACHFDWKAISPAVFGSMFQSVMDKEERRNLGAHYTREANILKVIEPLFMDDLRRDFARATSAKALEKLHERLSTLRFFDPACGCGNFLIVAYRELRRLELEIMRKIRDLHGPHYQMTSDVDYVRKVKVSQFFGIEIEEFPARIAETAMYLMDHLMNIELQREFGLWYPEFPIKTSAHICLGQNALRLDWNAVVPASECSYVFGNPPFVGKKERNSEQQADMRLVFGGASGTGVLDYVSAWYRKAAEYIDGTSIRCAFISTNSISQGEQVPILWSDLFKRRITIDFAHRTFDWSSEARGKAHVHVVVVGFSQGAGPREKSIYEYQPGAHSPTSIQVPNISPYLTAGPSIVVHKSTNPISAGVPSMRYGSIGIDDGGLVLEAEEAEHLLAAEPTLGPYVRRIIGARELLHDEDRYCLWLADAPQAVVASPLIRDRVIRVRDFRASRDRETTRELASTPYLFGEIRQPAATYLALPKVSAQTRPYIPMKLMPPDVIASGSILTIEGADSFDFAMLSSEMFMTWVRLVGGRMKSDYQLSATTIYNTFPWPSMDAARRADIAALGDEVIEIRQRHAESSLAEIYDPLAMPKDLVKAHAKLDQAVQRAYGRSASLDTRIGRESMLLRRYAEMTGVMIEEPTLELDI